MRTLLSNRRHRLKSAQLPRVWFFTDPGRVPNAAAAVRSLPKGTGVVFRHYGSPNRAALACAIAKLCRVRRLAFVVAGDWRLAAVTYADGLHLPEYMAARLDSGARLWRKRRRAILTVAAHGMRGVSRGTEIDADAAFLSPVFATHSHPDRTPLGISRAALVVRKSRLPVLALGGVGPRDMRYLKAIGFAGVGGVGFGLKG